MLVPPSADRPRRKGECYKVTSTKFMPLEGCDGSAGDDSSDEDEADCPFPCPAANDACPALEPLPEDECLPGNPAATDCVGHDCVYGSVHKSNLGRTRATRLTD